VDSIYTLNREDYLLHVLITRHVHFYTFDKCTVACSNEPQSLRHASLCALAFGWMVSAKGALGILRYFPRNEFTDVQILMHDTPQIPHTFLADFDCLRRHCRRHCPRRIRNT